ncbi:MAG TPA: hypothetical protein VJ302_26275 [Blastocatellia bacterium]|nr:hypothetical protein [Blastocatellia bacterium]
MSNNGSSDKSRRSWVNTGIVASIAPKDRRQEQPIQSVAEWFYKLAIFNDALTKMDDRQLLWCLMKSRLWERPIGSTEDMILQELADRLYPEFDGENVIWQPWGWLTPTGEIRYVND